MKRLSIEVDHEKVAEIEKIFYKEQGLKDLLNENMNSGAPAVKIIVDSYTETFGKRQKLMNDLEAEVLGTHATEFPHKIDIIFKSDTMIISTEDDVEIPEHIFNKGYDYNRK